MAEFFTMPNEERREAVNDDESRYARVAMDLALDHKSCGGSAQSLH